MHIAIFGASGFLGSNLVERLLDTTDWRITAVGRDSGKLKSYPKYKDRYLKAAGDVSKIQSILPILKDVDIAYYFVHMMGHKNVDFYKAEINAANTFRIATNKSGLCRVIFMGGLGVDDGYQSQHLKSRHETGIILRGSNCSVVELQASMIIGEGSVAYDIMRNIVARLPIMILPASSNTLTQPIALTNALDYLQAAATMKSDHNQIIQIGGPNILSYADIYKEYSKFVHKRPILIKIPSVPVSISSKFIDAMTPTIHGRIGRAMVDSMTTEMIVSDNSAQEYFPDIKPLSIQGAFSVARKKP